MPKSPVADQLPDGEKGVRLEPFALAELAGAHEGTPDDTPPKTDQVCQP